MYLNLFVGSYFTACPVFHLVFQILAHKHNCEHVVVKKVFLSWDCYMNS